MNKFEYFLRKNSPIILTAVASGGVILTTFLAIKATPKAVKLLKEAENDKGDELTPFEIIKYGWTPYIGCIISCMSTIICIVSIQYLNTKKQASIISAYTLLENSFNEYRDNIKNLYSEEADTLAKQEIIRAKYDPEMEPEGEEVLFFYYLGMRFFKSTMQNVMQAECRLKDSLISKGYACLNEYYDYLGIPPVDYGYQLGWADIESCDPYNVHELDFNYDKIVVGGSVDCWVITFNMPVSFDYII